MTRRALPSLLASLVLVALLACACSSSSSSIAANDGGADATTSDGGTTSACPSSAPINGAACAATTVGIACEYGGDAHGACTTVAQCAPTSSPGSIQWLVTPPAANCGINAPTCPPTFGAQEGQTCASAGGESCDYAQGRCACERCEKDGGAASGYWHCRKWNDGVSTDCPSPRPLLGSACTKEGVECDYARCCAGPALGPDMTCKNGTWRVHVSGGCACASQACP